MPGSSRRGAAARLGHGHGPQLGVVGQPAVQRAQERPAAALEVLPGVLAVQDDRDERLFPAGRARVAAARLDEPRDEVVGRRLGVPAGVGEADQIRQRVIAERAGDACAAGARRTYGRVEPLRLLDVAVAVARERRRRACAPGSARRSPSTGSRRAATSGTMASDTEPFGRPQARRPAAEQPLVAGRRPRRAARRASSGCAKRWRGIARVGVGALVDVGVAQQRQNRVIERRGRDLDLAARRRPSRYSGIDRVQQLELDVARAAPCPPR